MPKFTHEALGEQQSVLTLCAIACVPLLLGVLWWDDVFALTWWRAILAGLLLLDIGAGAVANFTLGTNSFYAQRPAHRLGFIAMHFHLPAFGWLVGDVWWPYWLVWAFTIIGALVVNALRPKQGQVVFAGFWVCVGLVVMPHLPMSSIGMVASSLFLLKVSLSFAVDHYRQEA